MAKAKKLPSGSWRALAFIGYDSKGKRKYKSFTAPTKKEAEFLAAEFVARNKASSASNEDMLLSVAYQKYIAAKENTLSPSTIVVYKRLAARDFPALMRLKLSKLTQENIQIAINLMSATHSPKSVRNSHGLLSAVLRMFLPNFHLQTRLPQPVRTEIYIPTQSEIECLIRSIRGTELEKAVLLAAFGSMRRSECCALTYFDISGDIVSVNKALVRSDAKEWVIKQPKSTAGYREIKFPAFVIERLIPASGQDRICSITPDTVSKSFSSSLKKAGLPHFRFHDLRHYQASILHAMGVPDKYIMERGGWRTAYTLKSIYQHTMSDKRKEVEDEICKRFEEAHMDAESAQNAT